MLEIFAGLKFRGSANLDKFAGTNFRVDRSSKNYCKFTTKLLHSNCRRLIVSMSGARFDLCLQLPKHCLMHCLKAVARISPDLPKRLTFQLSAAD